MRIQTKLAASWLVAIGVLGAALVAPSGAEARGTPRSFTVEGEILTMAPVTHGEFMTTCPTLPVTQGLGAFVVEVPQEFVTRPARATVKSTAAASLHPGIELSFVTAACERIALFESPPVTVPPGTAFIVVEDVRGVGIEFELTLTQR